MQSAVPQETKPRASTTALLAIVALVILGLMYVRNAAENESAVTRQSPNLSSGTKAPSVPAQAIPSMYDIALSGTTISKFSWQKEAFGNIMEASFIIQNRSAFDVKDIRIRCEHSANSGTVIDENTGTIYELVKAHSGRTFRNFNMGFINSQATRSKCEIIDLTPTL